MTSNLSPEELQTILDLVSTKAGERAGPAQVQARDFARPNRISAAQREAIRADLARHMPEAARDLSSALRQRFELELVEVSEVDSSTLFAALAPPFAVLRFQAQGEPGWATWDVAAAVAALEAALGSGDGSPGKARALSAVEKLVLQRLLAPAIERWAKALGLEAKDFRVADAPEQLGSWREGGQRADPQRLFLHVAVTGAGGESAIRVYVPGIAPEASRRRAVRPPAVPAPHLASVELEVSARLGSADIPLSDLLGLEVGDVIPLHSSVDEPLRLLVEERVCARAQLGSHEGMLAVRIEDLRGEDDRTPATHP